MKIPLGEVLRDQPLNNFRHPPFKSWSYPMPTVAYQLEAMINVLVRKEILPEMKVIVATKEKKEIN
jgi:hypothetical protein